MASALVVLNSNISCVHRYVLPHGTSLVGRDRVDVTFTLMET